MGHIASEQRTIAGITKSMSYSYNLDGSLSTATYPSGAVITYTPSGAGRMLSAVDTSNNINYATGATYTPDGSLGGFISGSGGAASITNTFTYNKRLQPVTMSAATSSATVFSIGYDFHAGSGSAGSGTDNGNVFGITNYKDSSRNQTSTYDSLDRLTSAQNAGTNCSAMTVNNKTEYWGNSYSYDAWGNLLGKTITQCGAENLGLTADAHNWIHGPGTDYQYDAAGNMTYDATANLNYNFDQENRITGAAGYSYTYDADGNRVEKVIPPINPTSGTLYWYMTPGIVAESDLSGTLKSEYVFFDGERVARKDFSGSTTSVAYYFSDHLKTASIITDAAGNIKADSDYYPWGGELQFINNDSNHYKFTGKERDGETGLDYFGARYYSNGIGRFITPDWSMLPVPIPYADLGDPQSFNLFSYVRNAPTTKFDTDGHQCKQKGTRFDCSYQSGDNLGNNYGPLYFGFAWGHHGFPGWSKLLRGTDAFKFFSRWRTGPLSNPDSNLYDQLHRQYNKEVEKIIEDYLKQSGKTEVKQLTKEEIKQLAQKIIDSRSPGIRTFFERLGASATSALEELINKIEINIVPPVPKILMQDILCRTGGCGGQSRG